MVVCVGCGVCDGWVDWVVWDVGVVCVFLFGWVLGWRWFVDGVGCVMCCVVVWYVVGVVWFFVVVCVGGCVVCYDIVWIVWDVLFVVWIDLDG